MEKQKYYLESSCILNLYLNYYEFKMLEFFLYSILRFYKEAFLLG